MLVVILSVACACSSKPPKCSDPTTVATLRGIIIDQVREMLDPTVQKNDPSNLIASFLNEVHGAVSLVTSDGYDDGAHKYSCHAKLKISLGNQEIENSVNYTSQATEDDDSAGVVALDRLTVTAFATPIAEAAQEHWKKLRYEGDWAGSYSCQGLGGATDGLKGPFSQHVYMQIEGMGGKLERTTKGGGIEKLRVRFDTAGSASLDGVGENTPDDRWGAHFEGRVVGHQMTADGSLSDADGSRILRRCRIQVTQESALRGKADSPQS